MLQGHKTKQEGMFAIHENDMDQRVSNINEKVQSLEKETISTKEDDGVKQTTNPTWALEIRRKLVDLEDRPRTNNLQILGLKEDPRESREECENKIYVLLEGKLEMGTSNGRKAACVGEKSKEKEKVIVGQFSIYQGSLRELKFPYLKIFLKRQCIFIKKNERRY